MKLVNYTIVLLFLISSCHQKITSIEDLPKQQVCLGSAGGISGLDRKTIFLKNGDVYDFEKPLSGQETIKFNRNISRNEARKIFKLANKLNFKTLKANDPCNMTYYIECKQRRGKDEYYSWCILNIDSKEDQKILEELLKLQNK